MFIREIEIKNYRAFRDFKLSAKEIGVPDGKNAGSGLTLLLGENGTGKTSIIDAISLGLSSYTTEGFSYHDLNNKDKDAEIVLVSDKNFTVKRAVSGEFTCRGLLFRANVKKIVSKQYMNKIIASDNLFISTNSDNPKSGSSDLRVNVNNPFSGPRFNENEYLILDKNRTNQIRKGRFSSTRFDRILEDYSLKYMKVDDKTDLSSLFDEEFSKMKIGEDFLALAIKEFNQTTGFSVSLKYIDKDLPFIDARLAHAIGDGSSLVNLEHIGSGYYMLLSLLISFYGAKIDKKNLLILIDEIELHLHPSIQKKIIGLILDISKIAQVFVTSHSTEVVKHLSASKTHKTVLLERNKSDQPSLKAIESFCLPIPTASETNYLAFGVESLEYHNELYGHIMEITGAKNVVGLDGSFSITDSEKHDWYNASTGKTNKISTHSVIRNYFHHPDGVKNNTFCSTDFINEHLLGSIKFLRGFIEKKKRSQR